MTLLELALAYAAQGWPVFPLDPQGKQPLGRLVPHGLKDASTSPDQIRLWWGAEPQANIGIPTGVAFDVADLDGEDSVEGFASILREHGEDPLHFPRARTGGGGRHLFVTPTGVGNRTRFLPGVDWRGTGGYIVAPGSLHPSGQTYEWISQPNGKGFPVAPPWLVELLKPPKEVAPEPVRTFTGPAPEAYVRRALEAEREALRQTPEGQRNDQLNRAAFALGQMVGAGWLAEDLARAELRAAALSCGLHDPEIGKTIQSGLSSGKQEPRQEPAGGFSRIERAGEIRYSNGASPTAPVDADEAAVGFDALVEPGPQWAAKAGERVPVIVRGFLAANGVAMMISDPKAGKTWLVIELIIGVASGISLLTRYPVEKTGKVLYIATEGSREGTLARLRSLSLGHGLDPAKVLEQIDFLWRRGVQLDDSSFILWLIQKAKEYTLIVVDVLAEAWMGDESRPAQVSKLLRAVREVTNQGPTVLLLHHLSKEQAEDQRSIWQRIRGSTAFYGGFDSGIGLERSITAKRTKVSFQHRDDVPLSSFTFTWPEELVTGDQPVSLDWQAEEETDLAAQHAVEPRILDLVREELGLSANQVAAKVGGNRQTALGAVKALVATGKLRRKEGTYTQSNGRVSSREGLYAVVPTPENQEEPLGTGTGRVLVPEATYPPPPGGVDLEPGTTTAVPVPEPESEPLPLRRNRFHCPDCNGLPYSPGPAGLPQRRCHGCGRLWTPGEGSGGL